MPASRKPRHKRRTKTTGRQTLRTQPWKTLTTFAPVLAILDQLEQEGTLTVIAHGPQAGLPVFQMEHSGEWFDASASLNGLVEAFEVHEQRTGRAMPLDPLRSLANKIATDQLIFPDDTAAARTTIEALRTESNSLTRDYTHDLVNVALTAEAFERLQATTTGA